LARHFETDTVKHLLKRRAPFVQPSVKRAPMQIEKLREVVARAFPAHQQHPKSAI